MVPRADVVLRPRHVPTRGWPFPSLRWRGQRREFARGGCVQVHAFFRPARCADRIVSAVRG
eukprot:4385528-Heterocapsa_arctica.AAC.1